VQYKQTLKHFIEAIAEYISFNMDGTVVIMGNDDGWGKLIIENAEIVSLNYGIFRGMQVLPELKKLEELRFMFRPAKPGAVANSYANAGSARMSNEDFFKYFDINTPIKSNSSDQLGMVTDLTDKLSSVTKPVQGRILVVDDSIIARKAASAPLLEYGFDVTEAISGFEALDMLDKEIPDLIILDLIMPGIDGYKVVDLLKKNERFKSLPIILVTSKDSLMDKMKGKMSSTDAYITKPYKEETLLKAVLSVLKN